MAKSVENTDIHELKDWPRFHWNRERLAEPLAAVRYEQGRLIGQMEALGFDLRQEAVLQTLTEDVLKSSEIEGEKIARRLGMDSDPSSPRTATSKASSKRCSTPPAIMISPLPTKGSSLGMRPCFRPGAAA